MIKNLINKLATSMSIIIASVIIIISYLLPLDKGVSAVRILPNLSIYLIYILIIALFTITFFKEKIYIKLLEIIKNPFIQNQIVIVLISLFSIKTNYSHVAIVYVVQYACIFLLNYINFHYLLKEKKIKNILINVAIISALSAAFIGIYEFITKTYPQPYRYFITITNGKNDFIADASSKYLLAKGTQGLHIIYAFLMAISICLSKYIKNKLLKIMYFLAVSTGCIAGISTTGFVILAILCFGMLYSYFFTKDFKKLKKYIPIIITIFLIVIIIFIKIPSLQNIIKRVVMGGTESMQMRADRTSWVIYKMKNFAENDIKKFLFGNGLKSSSPDYSKDYPEPSWWPVGTGMVYSLDNEYLSITYESGIIGLLLFCLSWLRLLLSKEYKIKSLSWWLLFAYMLGLFGLDFLPYSGINVIFVFLIVALNIEENTQADVKG